jgi:glucan-binding YG repeat protein
MKKIIMSLLLMTIILPIKANAEWKQMDGQWYYKEGNTYVQGWKNIDNNWYYFSEPDGDIIHGGIDQVNGKIYYFDNNGVMRTGWVYLKDNETNYIGWHYFYSDGHMAINTTIDGYDVNQYGTWVG